jgi:RNA polymerase sigma factor for flagellar operon FliA
VIESLPPRDRLVLDLYYHDELTLKEISRDIGVSESRVSQVSAALKTLGAQLRTDQLAIAA